MHTFIRHCSSYFRAKEGGFQEKSCKLELILPETDTVVGSIEFDSSKYLQNEEVKAETLELQNLEFATSASLVATIKVKELTKEEAAAGLEEQKEERKREKIKNFAKGIGGSIKEGISKMKGSAENPIADV